MLAGSRLPAYGGIVEGLGQGRPLQFPAITALGSRIDSYRCCRAAEALRLFVRKPASGGPTRADVGSSSSPWQDSQAWWTE